MLNFIMGLIGTLLYPLFSIIFVLIDLLQGVFSGLAGIGDITFKSGSIMGFGGATNITAPNGGDGGETSTGLIYYLLTSDLIKNLFLSIMTLALILIIIFTAMAFIKNAYASKQKTWQEIVGNAFKGLANFIFIPVCCLLGVWLSNILLVAINGATSTGGATKMSRKLYICCAYDANHYRIAAEKNVEDEEAEALESWAKGYGVDVNVESGQDMEYYAAIVDRVYAETNISIYDQITVGQHYSLFAFNYITLIVGGVFMLYVLVNLAYAMIKRMFLLLMLFVISPAICAMYPIDEGAAVGNWKKEFIKYTIAAYGAIAGLNLFFSILPIVEGINIVSWGGAFVNEIFQLLMMVCGLFVVKEFMGTLSGWIGGDNAMATGESLKKSATGAIKSKVKAAGKVTSGAFKAVGKARGAFQDAKGDSKGFKGFAKGFLGANKNLIGQGLGAMDKNGLNIAETFGIGHDDDGKKRKSAFDQGKGAYDKKKTAIQDAKDLKESKQSFLENTDLEWGRDYKRADEAGKNKMVQQYLERGEDAGHDKKDLYKNLSEMTDESVLDIKRRERDAGRDDRSGGVDKQNKAATAEEIAEAIEKVMKGKSTASGTESRVEETMRERQEVALLKEIRDLLSGPKGGAGGMQLSEDNLLKLAKANQQSAEADGTIQRAMKEVLENKNGGTAYAHQLEAKMRGGQEITLDSMEGNGKVKAHNFEMNSAQIEAYNAALEAKKQAEIMAKEATAALIKEFENVAKGNKLAEKAVEEFAKSMKTSLKDIEEFAKKLSEIIKK